MALSKKGKKTIIVISIVLASILVIFAISSIISVVGYRRIFDDIENYQPIQSTHNVVIGTDGDGNTTIKNSINNEPLKIMHLTDLHMCCSIGTYGKDKQMLDDTYTLISKNKPDLIVITGDAVYPFLLTLSTNNKMQTEAIGTFFEKIGIYWTVVFGNHDSHSMFINASRVDLGNYYQSLEHCLFKAGSEDVDGVGNYVIKTLNYDGSLNKVLMLMDSNSYVSGGINKYDRVHDNQIKWYEDTLTAIADAEGKQVAEIDSLLFLHIPLKAYQTAWDLYEQGNGEVEKHFGEKNENICPPDVEDNFFETIDNLNSTKAIFCGHDHLNNFCIEYNHVLLTYGMGMDYTAYLGVHKKIGHRGANIIILNENTNISIVQAPQSNDYEVLTTGYNI